MNKVIFVFVFAMIGLSLADNDESGVKGLLESDAVKSIASSFNASGIPLKEAGKYLIGTGCGRMVSKSIMCQIAVGKNLSKIVDHLDCLAYNGVYDVSCDNVTLTSDELSYNGNTLLTKDQVLALVAEVESRFSKKQIVEFLGHVIHAYDEVANRQAVKGLLESDAVKSIASSFNASGISPEQAAKYLIGTPCGQSVSKSIMCQIAVGKSLTKIVDHLDCNAYNGVYDVSCGNVTLTSDELSYSGNTVLTKDQVLDLISEVESRFDGEKILAFLGHLIGMFEKAALFIHH